MKLTLDTEWALHAKTNQKITWLLWVPLLPLLCWYQSSLVFWAQALWVPRLLARGAERQVASRTLHWHRHSWLARPNTAHCLAVSRRAPCSLGVQVDFWDVTETEIKLVIWSPSYSSDMSRYARSSSAWAWGSWGPLHLCSWAFEPTFLQAGLKWYSATAAALEASQ